MVYAVAMKTIRHFEDALGRPIFWSAVRPWSCRDDLALAAMGGAVSGDRYVQRLRLYPQSLREANADHDPTKRAILFGGISLLGTMIPVRNIPAGSSLAVSHTTSSPTK